MAARKVIKDAGRRIIGFLLAMPGVLPIAAGAETVNVQLDQAMVMSMPNRVTTVVVGNPLIADVSLVNGKMVITGKGYGTTNMIVFDRGGGVLMQNTVQVLGPPDSVTLYRGVDRESYSCAPKCERRINLGDKSDYFDAAVSQTGSRNSATSGASTATAAPAASH